LRVDLAQFRALEAFAMFASDLDQASRAQLARGQRLVELLKQPQYSPYPMEEQAVAIWTGTSGRLDRIPVEDVRRFESELLDHLRRETHLLDTIRETGELADDAERLLIEAVDSFMASFLTTQGDQPVVPDDEEVEALEESRVTQEKIVKQKRA
jgi:F-type H+-transporting ATPase subunit alpha